MYCNALRSRSCDTGPSNATTLGAGLSGCGRAAGGRSVEANKIAEIDVRARARAIRSAKACAEFFCCFFMWTWWMDWQLARLTFLWRSNVLRYPRISGQDE